MSHSIQRRDSSRQRRRGDDIPSVSEYAHWNEDAELMWFQENRSDMEYADEIIEDESYDDYTDDEDDDAPPAGDEGLCPICGQEVRLTRTVTTNGRWTATCGDAFTPEQWRND
jgi:hypothetical protein